VIYRNIYRNHTNPEAVQKKPGEKFTPSLQIYKTLQNREKKATQNPRRESLLSP